MKPLRLRPNLVISRPCLPLRPCRSPENVRNVSRQLDPSVWKSLKVRSQGRDDFWQFCDYDPLSVRKTLIAFSRKCKTRKSLLCLQTIKTFFQLWKPENNTKKNLPKSRVTHLHSLARISKKLVSTNYIKIKLLLHPSCADVGENFVP